MWQGIKSNEPGITDGMEGSGRGAHTDRKEESHKKRAQTLDSIMRTIRDEAAECCPLLQYNCYQNVVRVVANFFHRFHLSSTESPCGGPLNMSLRGPRGLEQKQGGWAYTPHLHRFPIQGRRNPHPKAPTLHRTGIVQTPAAHAGIECRAYTAPFIGVAPV